MSTVYLKQVYYLLLIVAFSSCNNISNSTTSTLNNVDSIIMKKEYPYLIVQKHYEKKYDNAVWLAYASNFHNKVLCECKNKLTSQNFDSTVISLEPLYSKSIVCSDTIEITIFFKSLTDSSCFCMPTQKLCFCSFGFFKNGDTVIYRRLCNTGQIPKSETMLNKKDFMKITAYDINGNRLSEEASYKSNLEAGFYPIDTQDSLFRLYVKAHKDQLAPTLMRLCKEKGVF